MGGAEKTKVTMDKHGFNPSGTSFATTVSGIVKSFIGAGALALSMLFMNGGVVASTVFLFSLASVALYAIFALTNTGDLILKTEMRRNMITRIKRQTDPNAPPAQFFEILPGVTDEDIIQEDMEGLEVPTYAQIGNAAIGPWGGNFVNFCLCITQIGILIAYVIFIATNFHEAIGWDVVMWKLLFSIPIAILLLIPDLTKLSIVGVLGNIVYLGTIAIIFYIGFRDFCCIHPADINLNNFAVYPAIFGTCSFALEGIVLVVPIKAKMRDQKQFFPVMSVAMFLVVLVYYTVGLGGYLLYGSATQSPIIASLPPGLLISNIARLSLSLSIFFTFPFQFFPITAYIDSILTTKYQVDEVSLMKTKAYIEKYGECTDKADSMQDTDCLKNEKDVIFYQRVSYHLSLFFRYVILALIVLTAIVFPDFKLIISLFGSFANSSLAYMAPVFFWMCIVAKGSRYVRNHPIFETPQSLGDQLDDVMGVQLTPSKTHMDMQTIKHILCTGRATPNGPEIVFPMNNVYFRDKDGVPIDVEPILRQNVDLLHEYLSNTNGSKSFATKISPGTLETSQLASNHPEYGSFDSSTSSKQRLSPSSSAINSRENSDIGDPHLDDIDDSEQPSGPILQGGKSMVSSLGEDPANQGKLADHKKITGLEYIVGWMFFPSLVVFVGVIASIIGVVDSIHDIVEQFGK